MKRIFVLEKFSFVDEDGMIYTSLGTQTDIDQYPFDYRLLTGPEISVRNLDSTGKNVIVAAPVRMSFQDKELVVCFMEIDMKQMLSGVSMDAQEDGATFCNMYTSGGIALSATVLGGLAVEDNLLKALQHAEVILDQVCIGCEVVISGSKPVEPDVLFETLENLIKP